MDAASVSDMVCVPESTGNAGLRLEALEGTDTADGHRLLSQAVRLRYCAM